MSLLTAVATCKAGGAGSGSRFMIGIEPACWKLSFLFMLSGLVVDSQLTTLAWS
jgi:hypothetical protein